MGLVFANFLKIGILFQKVKINFLKKGYIVIRKLRSFKRGVIMFAIAIYSDTEVQLCDLQGTEEDKDNQPMILVEACTENSGKSYRAILDLLDENEEARDDFGKLIARIVQEVQKYERERLGRKIVNLLD